MKKDLFVAYLFYRAAQNNGLDVADRIRRIRPEFAPEQISEAENDIRERNFEKYYYRDIREKKLPQFP